MSAGGIDIIGDKSYYCTGKFCLATQPDCTGKQLQHKFSPESTISLTLLYTQLLPAHSISLFYCTFTRKQNCSLEEYIRRGTTLIVKQKKMCNRNTAYTSQAARELVQESGGECRSYNIPFYKKLWRYVRQ